MSSRSDFKGNKASLPSKPCVVCGRPMSWRKAWAKNWEHVRYCSEACRKRKASKAASDG
jgi:hypothetical protein